MLTKNRFRRRCCTVCDVRGLGFKCAAAFFGLGLLAPAGVGLGADTAEHTFRTNCANCHSAGFRQDATDDELARAIREGVPRDGMPAFGTRFADEEIRSLVRLIRRQAKAAADGQGGSMIGARIEAEALNADRSANYAIAVAETAPDVHYVGNFDSDSSLCYDDIDLTGVRSIEFEYARGMNDPGRFAILISAGNGLGRRTNLGEKATRSTGGWETFRSHRVGLSRQVAGRHMLCFFGLDGGGIFNLDGFTLSDQPARNDGVTRRFKLPVTVLSAAGHEFTLEKVAEAVGELWAMAFLPDGAIISTQKNGRLWLLENGAWRGPVQGTPQVWNRGEGGLMDVKLHPDYARNGWVYLAYSDPDRNGDTMTAIVRGRIEELRWVDEQQIYKAPAGAYSGLNSHFGSRMAFRDGYLYFSIGDRVQADFAQDLSRPHGKIHRLHDDGRIPADNPFAEYTKAHPSIWSYGHRNPQGLKLHPQNRNLWSSEHGPMGGDELNVVRRGLNYGWPLVSFGKNYDGTVISESPDRRGMEPPAHQWTPSIGVSQIEFYTGARFPAWRNALLVGSLGGQALHLVRTEERQVVHDELLFQGFGRIRDVVDGPDGYPYVLLNNPNGTIYRVVPAT